METIVINTYKELIGKVKEITFDNIQNPEYPEEYYFRGQANKEWKLIPNLLRDKQIQENIELTKSLGVAKEDESKILLAAAQHYGCATRCLDFTRNYKIALYFACKPDNLNCDKDAALFIIKKYAHRPNWFTNYLMYYVATDDRNDISTFEFAKDMSQKAEIVYEFDRTCRSLQIDNVESEIQNCLRKGFMVDFKDNDCGDERIKKQEAALYYFGSRFYEKNNNEKDYISVKDLAIWSNQNRFYIDLHNIADADLENSIFCIKIIIPHELKNEIYEKIAIKASDLGLDT